MRIKTPALLGAVLLCAAARADVPSSGYASATVQDDPASDLTDFTLLVDLSELPTEWWTAADTADPTKGRAAKGDGATELAVDWIDYQDDGASGSGFARVRYSGTLPTAGGAAVRVYPPVSGNASYAAGATFGQHAAYDGDWQGYWPLHDLDDRTSGGLTLTAVGSPTGGAAGQLGDSYELDGSTQYLKIDGLTDPVGGTPMTVMAWFRSDSISATQTIFSIGDTGGNSGWSRLGAGGGLSGDPVFFQTTDTGGDPAIVETSTGYSASTWRHAAGVMTAADVSAYVDAGSGVTTGWSALYPVGVDALAIGLLYRASPANHFDGRIDDVQLHSAERSADWIAYEHAQTDDNATFWGAWGWTAGGGGAVGTPVISPIHDSPLFGR